MRPPGYVRRLPFDSLDHVLAATGVDRDVWRGLRVVAGDRDDESSVRAPEGEQAAGGDA
jgi:hypothetical protein